MLTREVLWGADHRLFSGLRSADGSCAGACVHVSRCCLVLMLQTRNLKPLFPPQFTYMLLVGSFPFNSFLAGIFCSVGFFVLTGALVLSSGPSETLVW